MTEQKLPLRIPVTRKVTRAERLRYIRERYEDLIFIQNEENFYTILDNLKNKLEGLND